MRRRFDLTPLGHPLWWGALALLVVNDHLLKGRGVVPGWLTGKLSDFAFLIVAPVLLAALIPRRVPGRRTAAVVAVCALYVAAELSRAVSDAIIALAARVGLAWRLWPDPTDLSALAILPVTAWLLRRPPRAPDTHAIARRARVQCERAGVVLGALACLATTPSGFGHNPFLLNRAAGPVEVRMTWVLLGVDCAATPDALGALLGPSDLDEPRVITMQPGDVAALSGTPPPGVSPLGVCAVDYLPYHIDGEICVAAILEAEGAPPVLMVTPTGWLVADGGVFCSDTEDASPCAPNLNPNQSPGRDALSIVDSGGGVRRFELAGSGPGGQLPTGSPIRIAPIDPAAVAARPPVATGCRETRDAYHALVAMKSCVRDSDCQAALPAIWLPGEPYSCDVYLNTSVSPAALDTLVRTWNLSCDSEGYSCPDEPVAPACIEATCLPSDWRARNAP